MIRISTIALGAYWNMTEIESISFMNQALSTLQSAVTAALENKAKLGQKAVVFRGGRTRIVSAKTLIREIKASHDLSTEF